MTAPFKKDSAGGIKLSRKTLIAGFVFLVLATAALTAYFIAGRNGTKQDRRLDTFTRIMRDWDSLAAESTESEKDLQRLNRELDRLEKAAISVESWLSVLKRRRTLAATYPPSNENYRKSIDKALEIYPAVQPIAAIAAEALIKNTAINAETEEALRKLLPVFTDGSYNSLRLALHVLLGDFNSPQRASVVPPQIFSDGTDAVSADLIILKIIRGDIAGAAGGITTITQSYSPSDDSLRLAAEFNYDFGDLIRSAEIFSFINDERAVSRQADALFLAGYTESARAIWTLLSDSQPPHERSVYNLGVTSPESGEAAYWFEKLVNQTTEVTDIRGYALIRYSRLLDEPQALSLLTGVKDLSPASNPFIDLEIIRRQPRMELGRQIAETWMLLDRHNIEELYFWAARLFLFQRNYSEIKILLNRMEINGFSQKWVKVFRAVVLMFEGELDTAEDLLRSIPPEDVWWTVNANLGCILEAQRSTARALEQYQTAAQSAPNPKTASLLLLRVARCNKALNRPAESQDALRLALELDPDNLTAKLELDRIYLAY